MIVSVDAEKLIVRSAQMADGTWKVELVASERPGVAIRVRLEDGAVDDLAKALPQAVQHTADLNEQPGSRPGSDGHAHSIPCKRPFCPDSGY